MTYACSAPERGLSLWDWTVGALHQDRCSVGVYRVGSELFGSLLQYMRSCDTPPGSEMGVRGELNALTNQ